jgi:hypothetical protein
MRVMTIIAATGAKACIERIASSAARMAQAAPAAVPVERTKQTLGVVELKSHLTVLKQATADIIA